MSWVEPERDVTVTCGSTEAMIAAMLGVLDPGDEVVVFEPFYENYGPDAILAGAVPRYVTLSPPDWTFDEGELAARVQRRARAASSINTPNNPTGKVFSREELEVIAELCQRWDAIVFTDEIYEHIIYDGFRARAARLGARARGPHRHDQRTVEDLRRDRLARRLDRGARDAQRRDPHGARLPDGGRARAAAGGGGGRARHARVVLRATRARVPRAARHAAPDPGGDRVRVQPDPRRVLRHGRRLAPRDGGRRRGRRTG